MVRNVCEKITENLDFVENSNFIEGNTETAVPGYSGVNLKKKSFFSNIAGLKPVTLLQ